MTLRPRSTGRRPRQIDGFPRDLGDLRAWFDCRMGNGFTTVALKSNHTASVTEGGLVARATLVSGGRTIQVWDSVVRSEETDRQIALFRNTQLLYRRAQNGEVGLGR